MRNRRRGGSPYNESKFSNSKKKNKVTGFDLGTIVLVRINDEGWIEARITRRSGDGTYDVQSLKEGRLLSSVSPTCVRLPPKMDLSSKRREMLAPLWWEHWGCLTGASVWTACVHAALYTIGFHFQIPSSLSNVLTWYSILSVILYVICTYAKGLPFDAARKVTAIASLASWALSGFAVLCAIRTFLLEIWQQGLGHLFYLPFAPLGNMTYTHVVSVCMFCASQSAVTWTHAMFGVRVVLEFIVSPPLTSPETNRILLRKHRYSRPDIVRICTHVQLVCFEFCFIPETWEYMPCTSFLRFLPFMCFRIVLRWTRQSIVTVCWLDLSSTHLRHVKKRL